MNNALIFIILWLGYKKQELISDLTVLDIILESIIQLVVDKSLWTLRHVGRTIVMPLKRMAVICVFLMCI